MKPTSFDSDNGIDDVNDAADVDDKRSRILDAALTAFSKDGYDKASTNGIAKDAGVAKGLVFHHFGSKQDLFVAVADDVIRSLLPALEGVLRDAPPEFFARVSAWTNVKFTLMVEDPRRLKFFIGAMTNAPDDVRANMREHSDVVVRTLMPRFFEGIDVGRLRFGVSADDVIDTMWALSAGLEKTLIPLLGRGDAPMQSLEAVWARVGRMFAIVKAGAYDDDD